MGPRSASGRLLTIAFLCLFLATLVIAQNVFAGTLRVVIPLSDRNLVNNVVPINYSTSMPLPGGACNSDCTYTYDGQVNFFATADTGWGFFQWTTAPGTPINATQSNPSANIDIFPPDSITVTADFIQLYQITTISDVTVSESDSTAVFTVTLDRAQAGADVVTVDYATADGSAAAGSDYTSTSGTLTFSGTDTRTITVPITNDALVEPSETFTVTLSNPSVNATIADATATGTILNNDSFGLSLSGDSQTEGTDLTFTVTLLGADLDLGAPLTVNYSLTDGTATVADSDYDGTGGTVTFAADAAAGSTRSFTVGTGNDAKVEIDEQFTATVTSGHAGFNSTPATATGTILNNDSFGLSLSGDSQTEGTDLTFTVTLLGADLDLGAPLTVNYSLTDGTATVADSDYDGTGGTVTFAADAAAGSTRSFTVGTGNDAKVEIDEQFTATVTSGHAGFNSTPATATGTILNNDSFGLSLSGDSQTEGTDLTFTVTLLGADLDLGAPLTVNYSLTDGTATVADSDYDGTGGTVTFAADAAAGSTRSFTVGTGNDAKVEIDEQFTATVTSGHAGFNSTPATATGTILNNDSFGLSLSGDSQTEGTDLTFTVTLLGADLDLGAPLTVNYSLTDGTATVADSDYDGTGGTVTFAADAAAGSTRSFTVGTGNDAKVEIDEQFTATVTSGHAGFNSTPATATGTILNNDSFGLSLSGDSQTEGTDLTFTVTLLGADLDLGAPLTVNYSLTDGTATVADSDYDGTGGTVTFAADAAAGSTRSFTVGTGNDAKVEIDEQFTATVTSGHAGFNSTPATATGTILNNDSFGLSLSGDSQTEGTDLTFTVTLLGADLDLGAPLTVNYSLTDGTATVADSDYDGTGGTVTFAADAAAGSTRSFTVGTGNDAKVEIDEQFTATVTSGHAGFNSTPATATGTILNNDSFGLSLSGDSQTEGTDLTFTVTLLGADLDLGAPLTVNYSLTDGTATVADSDYDGTGGTVTFAADAAAGSTRSFTVGTGNDAKVEIDEQFTATVTSGHAGFNSTPATATGTILNNDSFGLSLSGDSQTEGTDLTFTVTLLGADLDLGAPLTVNYSLTDGTATVADSDYDGTGGTVTFAADAAAGSTRSFTVGTGNDAKVEIDEQFTATVTSGHAGFNSTPATATGTILNNDSFGLSLSGDSQTEGTDLTFTVTLLGADLDLGAPLTVNYSLTDGTATVADSDYDGTGGTVTFAADAAAGSTRSFTVGTGNDAKVEIDEQFTATVTSGHAGFNSTPATATGSIVGWALNARMTTQLVIDAFRMAWKQCRPAADLTFHSDRGSQYTSHDFQRLLQKTKVQASMSGTGNCYDNAVVESFFSTLKMELIHHTAYLTREEAMADIFIYIEGFYNRKRRHSTLGYVSPLAFEDRYQQQVVK